MNKWICPICEYIIEREITKECPVCSTPSYKFQVINEENKKNSSVINIGIAKEASDNMVYELRSIFSRECLEVGMYLAMSKIASKEGYNKVANVYNKIAYEEAEHASILAGFLGEVVKPWTEENLKSIIRDEYEATQNKLKLAKNAKEMGFNEIYTALNEMCKDEVRHVKEFQALLNEYFVDK